VLLVASLLACLPTHTLALLQTNDDPRLAIVHDGRSHAILSGPSSAAARFDERGMSLAGGGAPLRLELARFGRTASSESVDRARSTTARGARLELVRGDGLVEWFENTGRGVQHGFDVATRPAGDGLVTVELAVLGETVPVVDADERGAAFVDAQGRVHWTYRGLVAFDRDGDLLPARMVANGATLTLEVDDTSADYPITIDPVAQEAYLKASNTDAGDQFGYAVAIDGDTAVVGAPNESSNAIGVGGNDADDSSPLSGAAYVFERVNGAWTQQAYLKASNSANGLQFAQAVAIDGDLIAVGSKKDPSGTAGVGATHGGGSIAQSGAVILFERSGGTWSQIAFIKSSNPGASDSFGQSVALDGDTLVVGAHLEDSAATGVGGDQSDNTANDAGAVYVFTRTAGVWSQQAYLKASNTDAGDFFGFDVDIDGDTLVVGTPNEAAATTGVNGNQSDDSSFLAGASYVFVRNGGAWSQQAYLKASNTGSQDRFGWSVAVSGDRVAVGAHQEDSTATGINGNQFNEAGVNAGAVYVYTRTGVTWSQEAYLKPAAPPLGDRFGQALDLEGSRLVIGAPHESSGGSGPYANQLDNSAVNAGAVYVFEHNGTSWSQNTYDKASNTDAHDRFGFSVAVSGDLLIAGTFEEDGGSTGVNGDDTDDSAVDAGAAYVFDLTAPWARIPGCLGNTGTFALPSAPPQMGTTVAIDLGAGSITSGVSALYYGALGIDVLGCGLPLGADELLLALSPFPSSLGLAPLVGGASTFALGLPLLPPIAGAEISLQAAIIDTATFATEVSNVLAFTLEL
jgi:hypothetical protein